MKEFKVGDVVRIKTDKADRFRLVIRGVDTTNSIRSYLCVSECGQRIRWAAFDEMQLVNRPDPQADLIQAIREVLLSDEFMTAFAAAFRSEVVSEYTFSDEVRSLEHPIPGVNRPMRNNHPLAANLVGAWVPNVSAEALETVNRPKILDSSNPSESPNSSSETPKPSTTQPPSGYRFLTKQDFHAKLDEFINATGKREAVPEYLIGQRASVVEPHGWIRRCEFERGERVTIQFVDGIYVVNGKEPGHIDCYSVQLDGFSSRRCRTVDAKNLIPLEQPTPPPKRYREPTIGDLKNGPIECEYVNCFSGCWEKGLLINIRKNLRAFYCECKQSNARDYYTQCRIEVR